MRKRKILYIVEAFGGGVFSYLVDLSNHLADKYDITIAFGLRPQTPEDYKEYFDSRIKLIQVENFGRSINPFKDVAAFFEIRRIAEKVKPDIIHLHSSKAGVLGRFAFNGRKIPMFYTPHGYSFLMQDQGKLKRFAYLAIEKISAKRCCTTISCSKGEHNETLKITSRAKYVSNGINVEKLQDSLHNVISGESTDHKKKITVFTLGRICYQKNPELFNQLALEFPNIDFIWIGDGELRDLLTARNIKVTGWMERSEALKIAQEASIFTLTSLWEGLPISLLEAMYMKKLCIVSKVIGNKDVIKTGKNGFLCESLSDYINAINYSLTKDTSNLTKRAYDEILSTYNTCTMSKQYDNIYQSFIREMQNT